MSRFLQSVRTWEFWLFAVLGAALFVGGIVVIENVGAGPRQSYFAGVFMMLALEVFRSPIQEQAMAKVDQDNHELREV